MNICQADGSFWQAVKAPAWLAGNKRPDKVRSLHAAINGHARNPKKPREHGYEAVLEKGNALHVLSMVRKREDVYCYMIQASLEYKRVQPKRAATYRRWLRQLERSRAR
jgi:hypothetical protein